MKTKNFNFHCGGLTSQEEMNVIYEDDMFVVLGDDDYELDVDDFKCLDFNEHEFDSGCSYWIFNKSDGRCVNDSNYFGCFRTITI